MNITGASAQSFWGARGERQEGVPCNSLVGFGGADGEPIQVPQVKPNIGSSLPLHPKLCWYFLFLSKGVATDTHKVPGASPEWGFCLPRKSQTWEKSCCVHVFACALSAPAETRSGAAANTFGYWGQILPSLCLHPPSPQNGPEDREADKASSIDAPSKSLILRGLQARGIFFLKKKKKSQ